MNNPTHTPEKDERPGRRAFLKFVAGIGMALTADTLAGNPGLKRLAGHREGHTHDNAQLAHAVQSECPELARDHLWVDLLGTGLFVAGVRGLLKSEPIDTKKYSALAALLLMKYEMADAAGKVHLVDEVMSNMKALAVITGTIFIGEGLKMDLQASCEALMGKSPDRASKVALLNMFGTCVAPIATTVGNASIISQTANDLAQGDQDFMAVSIGHGSGRAGYLLFGDPPFLAMIDKYGAKEGLTWQFHKMLPLALYSLMSATLKMNLILAKKEKKENPWKCATEDTLKGMLGNVGYLAKILASSLSNAVKYFSGADLSKRFPQDLRGIEVEIGRVLVTKITNISRLPWSKEFNKASPDDFAGIVTDKDDADWKGVIDRFLATIDFENMPKGEGPAGEQVGRVEIATQLRAGMEKALLERDFEEVRKILAQIEGGDNVDSRVDMLMGLLPDEYKKDKPQRNKRGAIASVLSGIVKAGHNTTDIHRLQVALGHNATDVLNVFPFQANCVPFLLPVFRKVVDKLEAMGLSQTAKEVFIFFLIAGFSMVADNYVAVKMGLELLPNKPQIPLIAGIEGGELTSIGNMANIAQFSGNEYPLEVSLRKMHWAIDNVAVGLGWALFLGEASIHPKAHEVASMRNLAKETLTSLFGNKQLEAIANLAA